MSKFGKIAYNALAALAVLLLSFAEVYNMRPFGTGMYFALLLSGAAIYVTAPIYLLSQALFVASTAELWGYVAVTAVGVIVKTVFLRLKKTPPLWILPISALGFCGFIYSAVIGALTFLNIILSALFALLFALVATVFLRPLSVDANAERLTEIEAACFCCVLGACALALTRPLFGVFVPAYAAAAFCSLGAMYFFGIGGGMTTALAFGIGMSLYELEPHNIAVLGLAAAVCAVFAGGNKFFRAAGFLLGFTVAVYLFSVGGGFDVLSAAIGCIAYALIPNKSAKRLKMRFARDLSKETLIASYNFQRRRRSHEIAAAADVFAQMSRVVNRTRETRADMGEYAESLLLQVCGDCAYASECACRDKAVMERLVDAAVSDGHTSVGALPKEIMENCRCIARLVSQANGIVERNKNASERNRALGDAALLLGSELKGAEEVMRKFASSMSADETFDFDGADRLAGELTYGGNHCRSALVRRAANETEAVAIVQSDTFDKEYAAAVLGKIYKTPFFFVSSAPSTVSADYECAVFRSGAPYDIIFGAATLGSDGSDVSGDTYSFTRTGPSGFMMAISDGMGSGEGAREISDAAISLVENYYRAGFDSAFILASVNRFLSMKNDERFSAMDVIVIDLIGCGADVIKIGCPPTYIKRGGKVAKVGGESLPLGALEEITPYAQSVALTLDDILVMTSDGVADVFDEGELETLLSRCDTLSPQSLASAVMDAAISKLGGASHDDMTVIAGRIFLKQ